MSIYFRTASKRISAGMVAALYIFFNSHVVARDANCSSSSSSAQTGGCVAYEHADFDGMRQDLGANKVFNFVGDDMNDKISSFRVSPNCHVTAWVNINRGGASEEFGECSYIGDRWNDTISSWECKCETPKPYGPDTCIQGYVWREATRDDHVCVTPEIRAQAWHDNETNPNETCPRGLVWREATPQDHICVDPGTRARAWDDNSHASERIVR